MGTLHSLTMFFFADYWHLKRGGRNVMGGIYYVVQDGLITKEYGL